MLLTRVSVDLVTATAQGWRTLSHVLFPGRFIDVELESQQSITSLCITSHTLQSMWKRRLDYAPCFLTNAAYAVNESSLEIMILSSMIAKKG